MKLRFLACACALVSVTATAQTTLRFTWWGAPDRHEVTEKAIQLFETRNPGIKIIREPEIFIGYQEKLTAQIASHTEPDIMQIDWAWLSVFSPDGTGFLDMLPFRQSLLRLDEFANQSHRYGMVFGKLNGLPTSHTSRVFIWNKQVFDRAGIAIPASWDDLIKAGHIFRKTLGKDYYPMEGNLLALMQMTHAYIIQKTGKSYILPHEPTIGLTLAEATEWLRFARLLADNHVIAPLPAQKANRHPLLALHEQPEWPQGKWAGAYNWASTLSSHAKALGSNGKMVVGPFLTLPAAKNNGKFARPAQLLVIRRDCPYPDIAVQLVNFLLTDPDATRILGTSRGIPSTRTGMETLNKHRLIEPYDRIAYEQINSSYIDFPSPLFESPEIRDFLLSVFGQVIEGKLDEKKAAELLINDGGRILAKIRPRLRAGAAQSADSR